MDRLSKEIDPAATPQVDDSLREYGTALDYCLDGCRRVEHALRFSPELLRAVQARFREAIWPWFQQSAFMRHALAKPRGYAGDYEMLIAIYEGKPRTLGFGGYLDLYFLGTELGRAVVARLAGIKQFLKEETARRGPGELSVLNIACGPAREYLEGIDLPADSRLNVICLDHDDAALDYVRSHVAPQVQPNIELSFVKYNALRMMSATANRRHFGEPDIIYSVGLCDYIPDDIMIRLLRGWRETAAPEGVVYVAFKDCLLYDAARYQWPVDWHFFQRTEEDCVRLFERAGYDVDEMEIVRDDTGSIMNFISRIPNLATIRLDWANRFATGSAHELAEELLPAELP
jgi:extracellular factor (EF) 3-hydroxypalmitic acid methyl ester biosynthesis protein